MKHLAIRPVLVILTFLVISCGDKDKQNNPKPSQSARLCRVLETNSTGLYESKSIHYYDSNGVLKSVKSTSYNRATITKYELNNLKQPLKASTWDTLGNELSYIAYEYNNNGKLSKRASFTKQGNSYIPGCYFTYQYDANGDLIRDDLICPSSSSYSTYTYSNLKKVVNIYSGSGTFEGSAEYEYDNRQIPVYNDGINYPYLDRFGRNPVLKYTPNTPPGGISPGPSYTCSYQFNAQGYPVQMIKMYQGNSNPETWTYTYDFQ